MAAMGLGMSMGGEAALDEAAIFAVDFLWEIVTEGEITPFAAGTLADNHDLWDLDGTDYAPADITDDRADEGLWALDSTDITPLDV